MRIYLCLFLYINIFERSKNENRKNSKKIKNDFYHIRVCDDSQVIFYCACVYVCVCSARAMYLYTGRVDVNSLSVRSGAAEITDEKACTVDDDLFGDSLER